jgi:hypothetical protein
MNPKQVDSNCRRRKRKAGNFVQLTLDGTRAIFAPILNIPPQENDMKIDRFVKTMLVVITVLLALNCAAGLRGPADAQSSGAKFGYIHIGDLVNYRNDPYHLGREVYDLRNGNVWAFPRDDRGGPQGNPVYLGTFDFSALDKSVQK